jgi:hypothetical protein
MPERPSSLDGKSKATAEVRTKERTSKYKVSVLSDSGKVIIAELLLQLKPSIGYSMLD